MRCVRPAPCASCKALLRLVYYWRSEMKLISLLKGKIHRVRVTEADVHYVGSITIDKGLMDLAGIIENELVHVWNVTNGERIETYAIPAPKSSGTVCINGAAAHKFQVGDIVIVSAFVLTDEPVEPKIVLVNEETNPITSPGEKNVHWFKIAPEAVL